jgi:adenylate cyclase
LEERGPGSEGNLADMAFEIERKFLVRKDLWYAVRKPEGTDIVQGYLRTGQDLTLRVRITENQAWLTIKIPHSRITRREYEYPIPLTDAKEILENLAGHMLEKTRYRIDYKGKIWEVDEFFGENEGLILAEIELTDENESFEHPSWLGEEVSQDHRYANSWLAEHPYSKW